jgi:hypothetical protein
MYMGLYDVIRQQQLNDNYRGPLSDGIRSDAIICSRQSLLGDTFSEHHLVTSDKAARLTTNLQESGATILAVIQGVGNQYFDLIGESEPIFNYQPQEFLEHLKSKILKTGTPVVMETEY